MKFDRQIILQTCHTKFHQNPRVISELSKYNVEFQFLKSETYCFDGTWTKTQELRKLHSVSSSCSDAQYFLFFTVCRHLQGTALHISACVSSTNNFWTSREILMKLGMEIISLEVTQTFWTSGEILMKPGMEIILLEVTQNFWTSGEILMKPGMEVISPEATQTSYYTGHSITSYETT
jgi:hypothetical protein